MFLENERVIGERSAKIGPVTLASRNFYMGGLRRDFERKENELTFDVQCGRMQIQWSLSFPGQPFK